MTKFNAALLACSPQGGEMAVKLKQAENWQDCPVYLPARYCQNAGAGVHGYEHLAQLVRQLFAQYDCLVFFCACGIAVRMIGPLLTGKYSDPAVVVCDEGGNFAVSLLSGHMGGANSFATEIAEILGAIPVITTATDVHGVFAVDSWAKTQQLYIEERQLVKEISSRLLRGEKIGFYSDYPWQGNLPVGLEQYTDCQWGICVSAEVKQPFLHTLHLYPRNLVLGVGCRKGIETEQVEHALQLLAQQNDLDERRIGTVATIDLKQQEKGLLTWTAKRKLPVSFYTTSQLQCVTGEFTASEFVQQITGVDNVCERSASLASNGGRRIVAKQKLGGITMAVYEKMVELLF